MAVHWIHASRLSKQDTAAIKQWKAKPSTAPPSIPSIHEGLNTDPHPDPPVVQATALPIDPTLRTFYLVNEDGYKMVFGGGQKPRKFMTHASLADVAKKAMHTVLQQMKRDAPALQTTQPAPTPTPPSSVARAVERAVTENFMCTCSNGCTNRMRCNEASAAQGKAYLQLYANHATELRHLNQQPTTIYLAEKGKAGVHQFRGGYRMVLEPSKEFIKQGYTTSVDATLVQTLHLTHVPQ